MAQKDDEDDLLRSVALKNANSILLARQRAEEELQRQTEWLRITLSSIGDAVISTDAEGRVTFMNGVAESLTGWAEAEGVGRCLTDVFRIVNEQTRQPIENPTTRALREGAVVGLVNHTVLLGKNGTERVIDDSAAPIRDGRGQVAGCVLIFRDITQRHQAEKTLREREQRLTALLTQAAVGIAQVDLAGRFLFLNQRFADLMGRSVSELLKLRVQDVTHPDDLQNSIDLMARVSSSGQSAVAEKRYLRPQGPPVWALTSVAAVAGDDDRPRSLVALVQDITDRKQAEEELRDADRRKNEFLAMLAHELRNPLAPIRNALQLVRISCPNPQAQVGKAYDIIERQIETLVRLVDDLLDVSRITSGKIQLQKGRVDLAAIVSRAVEGARPLIDTRRHTLDVKLPEDELSVDADPVRLAQVLWNLLNNAAKYTPEGGRIWLTAVKDQDHAVVSVRDTGLGIPQDMLPKVFDLFTQMERTLARAEGGLGIGLTLVRRLTEMHGGTVTASSAGPGQGSEFVVRLPLGADKTAAAVKPAESLRPGERVGPASGRRILIVDDNRDSGESLAMFLRLFGNDVRTAQDGRLALEVAAAYRPDVVLLDIGLPGLDGLEVCRRLRRQAKGNQPLIVAMTGYGQEEDRRRSVEAGFNAHMVKPVDLAALEELLSRPEIVRGGPD
jgi:PAS domain S-box-containing protein